MQIFWLSTCNKKRFQGYETLLLLLIRCIIIRFPGLCGTEMWVSTCTQVQKEIDERCEGALNNYRHAIVVLDDKDERARKMKTITLCICKKKKDIAEWENMLEFVTLPLMANHNAHFALSILPLPTVRLEGARISYPPQVALISPAADLPELADLRVAASAAVLKKRRLAKEKKTFSTMILARR